MTEATANPGAKAHHYTAFVVWDGNHDGKGTSSYFAYEPDHRIMIDSKATIEAYADPEFRGDP